MNVDLSELDRILGGIDGASSPPVRWNFEAAEKSVSILVPNADGRKNAIGQPLDFDMMTPREYEARFGPQSQYHYSHEARMELMTPKGQIAPRGLYVDALTEEGMKYRDALKYYQDLMTKCGLDHSLPNQKVQYEDKFWSQSQKKIFSKNDPKRPADCVPLKKRTGSDVFYETPGGLRRRDYEFKEDCKRICGVGSPDIRVPGAKKAFFVTDQEMIALRDAPLRPGQSEHEKYVEAFGGEFWCRGSSNVCHNQAYQTERGREPIVNRVQRLGINTDPVLVELESRGKTYLFRAEVIMAAKAGYAAKQRLTTGLAAKGDAGNLRVLWPTATGRGYLPPQAAEALDPVIFKKQARSFGLKPDVWKDPSLRKLLENESKAGFWNEVHQQLSGYRPLYVSKEQSYFISADDVEERGNAFDDIYGSRQILGWKQPMFRTKDGSSERGTNYTAITTMTTRNLRDMAPASLRALRDLRTRPEPTKEERASTPVIKPEPASPRYADHMQTDSAELKRPRSPSPVAADRGLDERPSSRASAADSGIT